MKAMTFGEVRAFLIKRYSLDAATASEMAKSLMDEHCYIDDCPRYFTEESLSLYLDQMEAIGRGLGG